MIERDSIRDQAEPASEDVFSASAAENTPDNNMLDFVTQLALRKWLIARVTGISILIGLALCFILPVRYKAVTTIMPPKQTESTTTLLNSMNGMGALAQAAQGGLLTDPNAIFVGLLKSRPVADAIIAKFDLSNVYKSKDMTAARKKLEKNTKIISEPSTLISITVTDRDKKRAADIANTYTEQLAYLTKSISFTEASKRRLFFEEQLKSQKEVLVGAELAFQEVQQNKGLIHLETQAGVVIGSLAELQMKIASKEVQLQAMRSFSTEHNAEVQLAEHELSALQAEAAEMKMHTQTSGYSDMGLKDVPRAGLEYLRAERELQYQQAFFDLLLRQFEAAKLDEAKEAAVIQVVEPAIQPDRKSFPLFSIVLSLSAVLGILLGCFIAIILRRFELEQSSPEGAYAIQRFKDALRP